MKIDKKTAVILEKKCLCVYSQVAHLTRVLRQLIEKREISLKLVLAKLNTLMKENEVRLVFPQHIYKKKSQYR